MKTLRDEIRVKYPERAARAAKSAKSAIRLFCIECCGGDAGEARRCQVTDCFLWPHVKAWRDQFASRAETASADERQMPLPAAGVSESMSPPHLANTGVPVARTMRRIKEAIAKEQGPPLDRSPGALIGKTLRRVEADGQVRECVVTERGFEYEGTVYTSISAAAKAASGRKAANGWEYWR